MGSRKRQRDGEATTTLMSLGDDMLAEILRRLPSQPSLGRAAFACPRLRNVASSVATSRFVSPGPLLGYFVSVVVGCKVPSFHRALLRSDRDIAGIVSRGDFHLADFEDYDWRLMDCRHGLLLLTSDRCMAVFDPVSRSRLRIPPHHVSNGGRGGKSSSFHCLIPVCGDAAASFRVLCLESTAGGRVRAHVYSSCTGEWCSEYSPAPKGIKPPRRGAPHAHGYQPMHAGRRIYWRTRAQTLTSLDFGSMEFSHLALPAKLRHTSSYAVGDTEDGTTCLVAISTAGYKPHMRVWFLKEEDGRSSSSWERQRRVDVSEWDLLGEGYRVAKVCDVTAGVVLLSMGYKHHGLRYRALRLSYTLREGNTKRQPVFLADFFTSVGCVHPFLMAWPRPSLKAAAGSTEDASESESEQEAVAGSNNKRRV